METAIASSGMTVTSAEHLAEMFSKLNPSAKEFVPSYQLGGHEGGGRPQTDGSGGSVLSADAAEFMASQEYYDYQSVDWHSEDQYPYYTRRIRPYRGRRRVDSAQRAEREESIRRTVYVSDLDHTITEEDLAALFSSHGKVIDCRICGDPNSMLRFAFVEFSSEHGARSALILNGTTIGPNLVKVLPSRTAILPVNPSFLPQSEDEREMCARTVYCTNIDRTVGQMILKDFFESCCGEVSRIRLLGDPSHSTTIAFVEFVEAEGAIIALNCSGMFIGSLPIRVSPSKTPIRPRFPRSGTPQ